MSRRGRSGPTISLFSFQDIITSVTAIVTVIALLLALDLVQRKQSRTSDSTALLAAEVSKRLEQLEAELAQLQTMASMTDELARELADATPADLQREITARQQDLQRLEQQRSRLEEQARLWKDREKEQLAEQFDLEPFKQEATTVEAMTAELERQRADEHAENRTIYSLPRGTQKKGWIVELESGRITIAPIGRAEPPKTFESSGVSLIGTSAAGNFAKWIDSQSREDFYFLLLLRPDSGDEFDQVHKMLETKKISHGFDLIDAERTVFHPERGAAL